MVFLILGVVSLVVGLLLMRFGRVMKYRETFFGAFGLVLAGLFLVILALLISLGGESGE